MILSNVEYETKNEKRALNLFLENRVDGIIVANPLCKKEYLNIDIPVVSIQKKIDKEISYVGINYEKVGELAANHFIDKGCASVLHIKGPKDVTYGEEIYSSFNEKLKGSNVKCDVIEAIYGEDIFGIGSKAGEYQGAFIWNDDLAITFLSECSKAKVEVPEMLDVISVDNIYYSSRTIPQLTTIDHFIETIGERAIELLIKKIKNKNKDKKDIIVDPVLILRGSSK